ncbi:hypothetical protein CXB51_030907 [Gossypium anomalum]|uniref:EF-hand domain-containing protein n=1 Tax=Gossypium anomalum TaxID=47600 RepID=A0A8J5YFJ8_9ROSI|nr:hypothetical protein CXB51_030907 [Gossypium anomalum]
MEMKVGFITSKKWMNKMLMEFGESKSVDGRMVMIKQFDLNGDGVTSFEEFRVIP